MNEFCAKIAEILDVEKVSEADVLADFAEWDSLSILSVIAMLDANYGVNITGRDLRSATTVGDIAQLLNGRHKLN